MSDESTGTIPLRQYLALLGKYLRPHLGWVTGLAVLLFSGVGVHLVSPRNSTKGLRVGCAWRIVNPIPNY